jgi:hypothetical protein
VSIEGFIIGLPKQSPDKYYSRSRLRKSSSIGRGQELPKELARIQSIFQWNDKPSAFKDKWVDYIEDEFDAREKGFWFANNGNPTYITGSHYMYLQWSYLLT